MVQMHKLSKTKKVIKHKKGCHQTKRNKKIHHGGNSSTPPSTKDSVCSKNINDLLIGEFRTNPNMLGSDPKNFANDIKKEAGQVKNVASGNWLSLPGPPPKFPTCSVM